MNEIIKKMVSNYKKSSEPNWMLYGVYGYSGLLLLEEAIGRGLKPIIAGRNEQKVTELAEKYDLDFKIFGLDNHDGIVENIKDMKLLLNAAGPFNQTDRPMIEACLDAGVDYLDISGEVPDMETCYSYHEQALEKKIKIIPGVGYDTVPSDCLANYVASKIENPTNMELAILTAESYSPGTMKGVIENIPMGSYIRRNGELTMIKMGSQSKDIPFLNKTMNLAVISWGDVASGYRSTKIPNITVYMALPKSARIGLKMFGLLVRNLFKLNFMQKIGKKLVVKSTKGPDKEFRDSHQTEIWCQVTNDKGEQAQAWMTTPESYKLTGIAGIRSVEKALVDTKIGALSPVQAFGVEFAMELPDVKRYDSREL